MLESPSIEKMTMRIFQILALGLIIFNSGCQTPQKTDLRTFFPPGTLVYAETADLSRISGVFTGNRDWKSLSGVGETYFSFLQNKQAALGLVGLENSGEGPVLQVKPNLVLIIDTEAAEQQTAAAARKALKELSQRFLKEEGEIEERTVNGTRWFIITGAGDKKIFSAVSGSILLIGNNEDAVKKCLEIKQSNSESLAGNRELLRAQQYDAQHGAPDQIAFGYVSAAGIKELSDYLAISYALKSSERALTREMISGLLPEMLQKTVVSAAWSARATASGVEDSYFIETEKEFARSLHQTIKPAAPDDTFGAKYLPREIYSVSRYRLEDPQLAWRGMVLSLAAKLDKTYLPLFEQFSGQMLKPYGIDDPELFLSAVDPQIITARFDEDGNESVVIARIKDKEKLKRAVSETFNTGKTVTINGAEGWASKDGGAYAFFIEGNIVIGNEQAALACIQAFRSEDKNTADPNLMPQSFSGAGGIVATRQKDDAAVQILSDLAARNNRSVEVNSYVFTETRIEAGGIKRRTLSAFGLLGEMLKQTLE